MKQKFVFSSVLLAILICATSAFAYCDDGCGGSGSGEPNVPIFKLPEYRPSPKAMYNIKYGTVELIYSQGPVITYMLVEKNYDKGTENILGYVHAKGYSHLKNTIDLYTKAGGYTFVWSYKDVEGSGCRDKWKW